MSTSGSARIIITTGQESQENPFLAEGELSRKAESIVRHSTISRTELKIYDPDNAPPEPIQQQEVEPEPIAAEEVPLVASAAPEVHAERPNDIDVKVNGDASGTTAPLTPNSVVAEVEGGTTASPPEPQKAEQVKVKDKQCKCCVLQ